jgi:hypothetical protein
MSMKRLWTIFKARNYEFFRDRAAFGWNFLFPFLIVAGFGIIFGGKDYTEYKIGLFPQEKVTIAAESSNVPSGLRKKRFLKFIGFATIEEGLAKLKHHKIDLLIKVGDPPYEYYVSEASPKGYVLEQIFKASLIPPNTEIKAQKKEIQGKAIRYIDWLFPGILAMNMMFLSEVWFSLEGAPQWLTSVAQIFPLTHLLNAARKIMHDGAGLMDVSLEIVILSVMTLAFLTVGAALFSWNK